MEVFGCLFDSFISVLKLGQPVIDCSLQYNYANPLFEWRINSFYFYITELKIFKAGNIRKEMNSLYWNALKNYITVRTFFPSRLNFLHSNIKICKKARPDYESVFIQIPEGLELSEFKKRKRLRVAKFKFSVLIRLVCRVENFSEKLLFSHAELF
jgi:hypothetical protein